MSATDSGPALHRLAWDGATLLAVTAANADLDVALDGAFFLRTRADANGRVVLHLPWSPSGRACVALSLGPHPAVGLVFGRAGIVAAPPPQALAQPAQGALVDALAQARDLTRAVVVVVPVYNAPEHVAACLDSVLAQRRPHERLLVIDDASPDPHIAPLLARYAQIDGVEVLRNATNQGFTSTANRGIAAAGDADVVLLNADTEVAPLWLAGLRRAAYSRADIASATAVSDNAGAFSVPDLEQANALPDGWTLADAARALRQHAGTVYPQLPTGNGFCLYLKRAALAAAGLLDAAAFPQGYGEENDWCQRAAALGWRHVIAGDVLVRHARSQSFGDERRARLGEQGMAVLRARWPRYEAEVGATLFSYERRVLDWRVRRAYAGERPRPRWLVGADAPVRADVDAWRVIEDAGSLRLQRRGASGWLDVERVANGPGYGDAAFAWHAAEQALSRWLQRWAIEAVAGDVAAIAGPRAADLCAALGVREAHGA